MKNCRYFNCTVLSINSDKIIVSYGKNRYSIDTKTGLDTSKEYQLIPSHIKQGYTLSIHELDFMSSTKLN